MSTEEIEKRLQGDDDDEEEEEEEVVENGDDTADKGNGSKRPTKFLSIIDNFIHSFTI